ncbi:MAG: hypothetical protein DKT66_00655 [Candidatus Melainabacteria bacterium]|nr:MAG: hypothetical protein DKT66_00655 [Candidatus Melainabacteria bacterium]
MPFNNSEMSRDYCDRRTASTDEDVGMTMRAKVASECEAPLYKQLEESIIADIVAGRLKPGDVVPSTYTLAERHGISRVTAVRCYEELKGRGYLTARRGGSTVVNPGLVLPGERSVVQSFEPDEHEPGRFDNCLGAQLQKPPAQVLPTKAWMKAMQAVCESNAAEYSGSAERLIAPRLRSAVAAFLLRMRGLSVYSRNILVFDSKWNAMAFVAENFLERGDTVAVENPGDPLFVHECSRRALELKLMPIDREGAVIEHLEPRCGAKLIAVSPSAHFPTGAVMSERRRQQLARYAGNNEAIILEDDGYALLRFGKQPEPSLYNKFKNALHLGSFGAYLGHLCQLSYLVVPDHLLERLAPGLDVRAFSQPTFVHLALASMLESSALELAIFKQRATLQKHRQEILSVLINEFKDILSVNAGSTGCDLLLRFHSHLSKELVLQALDACRIERSSLERCYAEFAEGQRVEILLPLIGWHDPSGNSVDKLLAVKRYLAMCDIPSNSAFDVSPSASIADVLTASTQFQSPSLMYTRQ